MWSGCVPSSAAAVASASRDVPCLRHNCEITMEDGGEVERPPAALVLRGDLRPTRCQVLYNRRERYRTHWH